MTPTQRTLKELRAHGMACDIVERWIPNSKHPGGGFRKDMFGIIDLIALSPHHGVIGVQCCGSDFAAHLRKITIEKANETRTWLKTPGTKLQLWSWRKLKKKRGGKAMVWKPRVKSITLNDLEV